MMHFKYFNIFRFSRRSVTIWPNTRGGGVTPNINITHYDCCAP